MDLLGPAMDPDGQPLPEGTVVLALDPQGTVCGATVVTVEGQFGLMACYGDDPTTLEDEEAVPGDVIHFQAHGVEALGGPLGHNTTPVGPGTSVIWEPGDRWAVELVGQGAPPAVGGYTLATARSAASAASAALLIAAIVTGLAAVAAVTWFGRRRRNSSRSGSEEPR
jgi:hypothetical protein